MYSDFVHELLTQNHEDNSNDLPVWCIGDVHGCADEYEKILLEIKRTTPECIIYQLGDLIDRGPDLYDVFFLSMLYEVRTLIGNHELNFIQEHFGYKQCRSKARRETHHKLARLNSGQRECIIQLMLEMKNCATVERMGKTWTLSHAPIVKDISIREDCGSGSNFCMGSIPYTDEPKFQNSVHGHMHWAYTDIKSQIDTASKLHYNLDAGCVYGGELVAFELGTKEVIRIPGTKYSEES